MKVWVLLLAAIATLPGGAVCAQDISGNWQGVRWDDTSPLENNGPFHTVLEVSKADGGGWKAFYYEDVTRSRQPIPVTSITFRNMELKFLINPMHLHYRGKLSADGASITGSRMMGCSIFGGWPQRNMSRRGSWSS